MPAKEDEASDSEEELFEDLEDMEVGRVPSKAPAKESKTKGPDESDEDEDEEEEHPKIGKTLLIVGILLCVAGWIGVLGLRTNVIQHILGDPDPYPGIGYVEPWGHIVSVIPFVLGFMFMLAWGIKNDPIYYENQKRKEEEKEEEEDLRLMPMPIDQADVPEELSKPLEGAEEIAPAAPGPAQPILTTEEAKAEEERIAKCEKMLDAANILPKDRERLRSLITTSIAYQDFVQEITIAVKRKKKEEKKLSAEERAALLREELAKREREGAPAPTEEERVLSCEKILADANVMPDDRERLKLLIPSGISTHDFSEEIKKIIEKKKKKDEEKKLSADEKAAMLEEELATELTELEDALDKGGDDDELEQKILKEIEDLENL